MIFSTIDIGTNTILMVTVRVAPDGAITVLGDEHEIARLGKGVDASRKILPETIDRVEGFLRRYQEIAARLGSERIVAFGTSALRDAINRREFIDEIERRIGLRIEVLGGEEEAQLTFRGALFGLPVTDGPLAVLDIGGGSTEIATGDREHLRGAISLDIGAVRITERHLPQLPPTEAGLEEARRMAREILAGGIALPAGVTAIGVAGTVTTLGAIDAGIERFDAEELNGRRLASDTIDAVVERLARLSGEETAAIPQVSHGRADILLGGAIILQEFMRRYALPEIIVSTRGVRYGVMLREVERMTKAGRI